MLGCFAFSGHWLPVLLLVVLVLVLPLAACGEQQQQL